MKKLDRNKKYYLGNLSDEQLCVVLQWLKENDNGWEDVSLFGFKNSLETSFLIYPLDGWYWSTSKEDAVCATELFEPENDIHSDIKNLIEKGKQQGLKIVVTFESL